MVSNKPLGFGQSQLLTLTEAHALHYGHPSTLRRHIHNGSLPAQRHGNKFKVSVSDLDVWITTTKSKNLRTNSNTSQSITTEAKRIAAKFPVLTSETKADIALALVTMKRLE